MKCKRKALFVWANSMIINTSDVYTWTYVPLNEKHIVIHFYPKPDVTYSCYKCWLPITKNDTLLARARFNVVAKYGAVYTHHQHCMA